MRSNDNNVANLLPVWIRDALVNAARLPAGLGRRREIERVIHEARNHYPKSFRHRTDPIQNMSDVITNG
jgi:hypothetical protein